MIYVLNSILIHINPDLSQSSPISPMNPNEAVNALISIGLLLDLAPGAQRSPLRSMESNVDPGASASKLPLIRMI